MATQVSEGAIYCNFARTWHTNKSGSEDHEHLMRETNALGTERTVDTLRRKHYSPHMDIPNSTAEAPRGQQKSLDALNNRWKLDGWNRYKDRRQASDEKLLRVHGDQIAHCCYRLLPLRQAIRHTGDLQEDAKKSSLTAGRSLSNNWMLNGDQKDRARAKSDLTAEKSGLSSHISSQKKGGDGRVERSENKKQPRSAVHSMGTK